MTTQKIKLLLDLDGVLASFDGRYNELCTSLGIEVTPLEDRSKRYYSDHVEGKKDRSKLKKIVLDDGWFRNLPVIDGAQEGVEELLSRGIQINLCSKPLMGSYSCPSEKYAWVKEHFPMLESKLFLAPDKSEVRGDFLLDDAPKPRWFKDAEWHPIIFTQPFNDKGSEWEDYYHWEWEDGVENLVQYMEIMTIIKREMEKPIIKRLLEFMGKH